MKTKRIYNPLKNSFTVLWAGDENDPKPYSIEGHDVAEFPEAIANHIEKHLAEYIVQMRGVRVNHDYDIIEIKKEIEDVSNR